MNLQNLQSELAAFGERLETLKADYAALQSAMYDIPCAKDTTELEQLRAENAALKAEKEAIAAACDELFTELCHEPSYGSLAEDISHAAHCLEQRVRYDWGSFCGYVEGFNRYLCNHDYTDERQYFIIPDLQEWRKSGFQGYLEDTTDHERVFCEENIDWKISGMLDAEAAKYAVAKTEKAVEPEAAKKAAPEPEITDEYPDGYGDYGYGPSGMEHDFTWNPDWDKQPVTEYGQIVIVKTRTPSGDVELFDAIRIEENGWFGTTMQTMAYTIENVNSWRAYFANPKDRKGAIATNPKNLARMAKLNSLQKETVPMAIAAGCPIDEKTEESEDVFSEEIEWAQKRGYEVAVIGDWLLIVTSRVNGAVREFGIKSRALDSDGCYKVEIPYLVENGIAFCDGENGEPTPMDSELFTTLFGGEIKFDNNPPAITNKGFKPAKKQPKKATKKQKQKSKVAKK